MPDLSYDVVAVDRGAGRVISGLTDTVAQLADRLSQLDGMAVVAETDVDTRRATRGLDDLADRAGTAGDAAGEQFSSGLAAKLAGVAAIGATLGTALMGGLTATMDAETATARLQVQLGATGSAAGEFGRIAGSLYSQNFGGSLQDVNDAISLVFNNMGESAVDGEGALENITATVLSLSDAFGVDLAESTLAVGNMIRTGMAPNATAALDMITHGLQNGMNRGQDFVSTLAESSGVFQRFGLDGQASMSLMQQAFDAGAPSAEFFVGMLEELAGNAGDSAEVFATLGLNGQQMSADLSAGGERAKGALDLLMDALRSTEDPSVRATALVGLFGEEAASMQQILLGIDPSQAVVGLDNMAGAAQRMNDTLGDTAASKVESLRRSLETGLVNFIGGQVVPVFETLAGWGSNLFGPAWEPVKSFLGFLAGTGGVVAVGILAIAAATWAWTTAMGALSAASLPITGTTLAIAAGIGVLVAAVVWAWNNFEGFRNVVFAVWAGVQAAFAGGVAVLTGVFTWLTSAVTGVGNFFSTVWNAMGATNQAVWDGVMAVLTTIWTTILGVAQAVWNGIAAFFTGLWNGMLAVNTAVWNGILGFLTGIWNGIASVATTVWNGIGNYFESFYNHHRSWIDATWNAIRDFLSGIWNGIRDTAVAVWTAISDFFVGNWNQMVTDTTNTWNTITSVVTTVWNAIAAFFTGALDLFLAGWNIVWNAVAAAFSAVWNTITAAAQVAWAVVSTFFQGELNRFNEFWTGIWNAISGVFSAVWDRIVGAAQALWAVVSTFFTGELNKFTGFWSGVWNGVVADFQRIWGGITGIAQSIWGGVTTAFRAGVNAVIDVINWMADKVNIVLRFFLIPEIPDIPRLETGGVLGGGGVQMLARGGTIGSGFVTDGPRAIVGEGNPNHPEFVIPTDPKYRRRALALYESLGGQLMADGGVLGWIGDAASTAWGGITSAASAVGGAISDVASWVGGGVDGMIQDVLGAIRGMLPGGLMGDIGMGVGRRVLDGLKKMIADAFAKQQESTGAIGGATGSGGWQWMIDVLRQAFPGLALISGMRPGAITATGNRSYHAQGRAVDVPPRMDVFNWIKSTYGGASREIIYSPAGSGQIWNGQPHMYTEPTRGDHWDHVHWAYANGGFIDRPTFGLLGEAGPEVVLPLSRPSRAAALAEQAGFGGGLGNADVVARLDALHDLLERRGAGASITIQDRSGNPTETARSTVLALRLV